MPNWKKLFSTPRRAVLTIGCIAVLLATVCVCIAVSVADRPEPDPGQGTAIGGESAQNFAFADAGVDPVEAAAVSARYGRWEGRFVYEVEFIAGGVEYTYKIDAFDGSVVQRETKAVKGPDESAPQPENITLEEAREIALKDAGLTRDEVTFTEAELDGEDGQPVYEFKFYVGNVEYGYEINAQTGAVYSKSTTTYVGQGSGGAAPPPVSSRPVESAPPAAESPVPSQGQPRPDVSAAPQPSVGVAPPSAGIAPPTAGITPPGGLSGQGMGRSRISLDEAKRAALEDAGVTEDQVVYKKTELDYDHGMAVYELEFVSGGLEYEYEIDAVTGAVVESSWDHWD